MNDPEKIHEPVLLREVLSFWHRKEGGFYVDGTVGAGGHAEALLARDPGASLLGIDKDPDAVRISSEKLKSFGGRVTVVHADYSGLQGLAAERRLPPADGILLDLGVSSLQFDRAERGFSFRKAGPLDMRMDPSAGETALDLIRRLPADELGKLIRELGEERFAGRIAGALKKASEEKDLNTTECAEVIVRAIPYPARRPGSKIHPATRTFQALRIAVNRELDRLKLFLRDAPALLASGGRMAVISFHSLEDRMVKKAFRELSKGCVCPPDAPRCVCGKTPAFKTVTRKAVRPTGEETKANPRSRSAKMRVIEKI